RTQRAALHPIEDDPGVVRATVVERTENVAVQVTAQNHHDPVEGLEHLRSGRVSRVTTGEQVGPRTVEREPGAQRAGAVVDRLARLDTVHIPGRTRLAALVHELGWIVEIVLLALPDVAVVGSL